MNKRPRSSKELRIFEMKLEGSRIKISLESRSCIHFLPRGKATLCLKMQTNPTPNSRPTTSKHHHYTSTTMVSLFFAPRFRIFGAQRNIADDNRKRKRTLTRLMSYTAIYKIAEHTIILQLPPCLDALSTDSLTPLGSSIPPDPRPG